jgi:hypothetical protein
MICLLALIVAAVVRHKRKQGRRTSIHIDWELDLKPVRVDDYRLTPIPALEEVTGKTYTREDTRRDALLDRGR